MKINKIGRRALGAFLKHEGGASGTEFALVMLPMIFIFMFIIQFGMVMFVQNDMQNAARAGARQLANNEAAVFTTDTATPVPILCGTHTLNTVEHAACEQLSSWSASMTFGVTTMVREAVPPVPGTCEDIEVVVSIPMDEASVIDLFGIFSGRMLRANAIIRAEYDRLEGGAPIVGNCV